MASRVGFSKSTLHRIDPSNDLAIRDADPFKFSSGAQQTSLLKEEFAPLKAVPESS